jgi:hypothetical protein
LAALHFPTFFEVREILPKLMQEWGITQLSPAQAAMQLAKRRAREILQSNEDPLNHAGDFFQMWVEAGYCRELADYGELADEVYIALECGEPENQVRARLLEKLKALTQT